MIHKINNKFVCEINYINYGPYNTLMEAQIVEEFAAWHRLDRMYVICG